MPRTHPLPSYGYKLVRMLVLGAFRIQSLALLIDQEDHSIERAEFCRILVRVAPAAEDGLSREDTRDASAPTAPIKGIDYDPIPVAVQVAVTRLRGFPFALQPTLASARYVSQALLAATWIDVVILHLLGTDAADFDFTVKVGMGHVMDKSNFFAPAHRTLAISGSEVGDELATPSLLRDARLSP